MHCVSLCVIACEDLFQQASRVCAVVESVRKVPCPCTEGG